MTAISAKNVSVQIKGQELLDSVTFAVEKGEWLSIIGPNGAGKSTLLRSLAGALDADGSIEIEGKSLHDLSVSERAKLVAWVPQTPTIPEGMNVTDYVLLGRTPYLGALSSPSKDDVTAAAETLARLDLHAFAQRKVETLSGGERQRVVIARSLVQDTPIILLDEPTSALDLGHQQDVLELLDQLIAERGKTIVSTMHDLTLAGHFADRLLLLGNNGTVAAHGLAENVLTEANIAQHYGAEVTVTNEGGTVVVSPKIAGANRSSTTNPHPENPNPESV